MSIFHIVLLSSTQSPCAKSEVRFRNQRFIYDFLYGKVNKAITTSADIQDNSESGTNIEDTFQVMKIDSMEKTKDKLNKTFLTNWSNHYVSWKAFPIDKLFLKYEESESTEIAKKSHKTNLLATYHIVAFVYRKAKMISGSICIFW